MQKNAYLVKIATYLILVYIIFALGKSLWTNYELNQSIKKLNTQIATLEQQKIDLNNLITYYQSDSFKELEARRKLGLKLPEEKVAIVGEEATPSNFSDELQTDQQKTSNARAASTDPNWVLWWQYFTK